MRPAPAFPPERVERFGAAAAELAAALDWRALGECYCESGGADFFAPPERESFWDAGLLFAGDLLARLGRLPAEASRRSVYVGAALFELLPALAEALLLEREPRLLNLPGAEVELLNAGLARAASNCGQRLPRIECLAPRDLEAGLASHVWMVSVLNDPVAFPALHDHLYGRQAGDPLATGRGELVAERARARALCADWLARASEGAWLHTSDEEWPLVRAELDAGAWHYRPEGGARLSAIVGDPVRAVRLLRRGHRRPPAS